MGKNINRVIEEIILTLDNHKQVLSNLTASIGVLIQKEDALRTKVEESNLLYNEFRAKYNDMLDDIRNKLDTIVRSGPDAVERRLIEVADNIDYVLRRSQSWKFSGPSTAQLAVELELRKRGL